MKLRAHPEAGPARGHRTGGASGQSALLLKRLRRKFGTLPEGVEQRAREANACEIELWAERVLVASSIEDVLAR